MSSGPSNSREPNSRAEGQGSPAVGPHAARQQARSAQKQQRLAEFAARRRRERFVRWGAFVVVALVVLGAVGWLGRGQFIDGTGGTVRLPGPEGGDRIAQDVNTLVGQPAPPFTLADADGTSYAVTPGQGRPIVLVSHMGIT